MPRRSVPIALALVAALCFAPTAALAADADVRVDDAWVRATVPGQRSAGAYMTLTSPTSSRLVGVATPAAGVAQIHEMAMEGTTMRMHPVDGVALPAGQAVALKPGGYHVMLMELKQPLKVGDRMPLTMRFEDADRRPGEKTVQVDVRDAPPSR